MPGKSPKELARQRVQEEAEKRRTARKQARSSLGKLQIYIGAFLISSALFGVYLLATDNSLWILAASHAYGLVAIVGIDLAFGVLSILLVRQVYLPSIAAAFFGLLLQIGDIVTASQYGMTIEYFATYLFSLWAFDALVAAQGLVLFMALFSRVQLRTLGRQSSRYSAEFSASRRQFLYAMMAFAGLVGLAGLFSVIGQSRPPLPTNQPPGLPAGAVGNVDQLQPGAPSYFEYPLGSGLPNILLKKSDGNVIGMSMLCTHVCCQLGYDSSLNQLYCPCHGSVFDENGNVLRGPANYPLPTITLTQDSSKNLFPQATNGYTPCAA